MAEPHEHAPLGYVKYNGAGEYVFRQGHPANYPAPEWTPVYRHPPPPTARLGTPITTEQATAAVLGLIPSAMLGDISADPGLWRTFDRIYGDKDLYRLFSKGERHLVDIAHAIWHPHDDERGPGARISKLGGLDPENRLKVMVVLAYLHLGNPGLLEVDNAMFIRLFEPKLAEQGRP